MLSSSAPRHRRRLRLDALTLSRHSVLSRHSALSSVRELHQPTRAFSVIVGSIIVGCTLIGVAVNLMVAADLGLAPYDVLSSGVSARSGLSLGQAGWLLAATLFTAATLLGQRPNAWGVLYVLGNGVAIDLTKSLINAPASYASRFVMVGAAIVIMAFGINFVVHAGVTGGAFELLTRAGVDRGLDPIRIRYCLDLGILVAGVAIGGPLGVATVVYAGAMGLVFSRMRLVLEDHRAGRAARLQRAEAVAGAGALTS